jgi:hypothetical protein
LADCLKKNTTLKKIVLEENKITDKGVQYFIDELVYHNNSTLTLFKEQNTITNVSSIVLEKNPGINKEEMLPKLTAILEKTSAQKKRLIKEDKEVKKEEEKKPEEEKQDKQQEEQQQQQQETEQVKTRVASTFIEGQNKEVKKDDFLEFL